MFKKLFRSTIREAVKAAFGLALQKLFNSGHIDSTLKMRLQNAFDSISIDELIDKP